MLKFKKKNRTYVYEKKNIASEGTKVRCVRNYD